VRYTYTHREREREREREGGERALVVTVSPSIPGDAPVHGSDGDPIADAGGGGPRRDHNREKHRESLRETDTERERDGGERESSLTQSSSSMLR
jgi:hypothetical protein